MTRAAYRAWKRRNGVHRSALTQRCRDCRAYVGLSYWRARVEPNVFTLEMAREIAAGIPSLYDAEHGGSDDGFRTVMTTRKTMELYRQLLEVRQCAAQGDTP